MARRENVLLVANYEPQVGYAWWLMENFWLQMQGVVAKRGGQCLLIYPRPGRIPQRIADSSIEVVILDFEDRSIRALGRLRRLIRSRNIGSVYLSDRRQVDWCYFLLRIWGVRRIILHNHAPGERSRPPMLRLFAKRFLHWLQPFSCDLYIGVSEFVARRMVEVEGVPRRCVTYVHNGVPRPAGVLADKRVRELMGVAGDGVLVVNVGRAHRYKGIDFMLDVAAEVSRRGVENVAFMHVGGGPDLDEFKSRALQLGLGDKFHFAGPRDDVYSILLAADIALHTSLGEAFSLAVLEYMSAGLAVLLPDHCGNPEAVQDGVDGALYEPGNLREATSKLLELVQRPEWRRQLGTAARAKVDQRFRLEDCNRKFRHTVEMSLFGTSSETGGDARGE